MKILATLGLLGLCAFAASEPAAPAPAPGLEQHRWLQQFVGDWTVTTTATDPGGTSMTWESRESVRAVGAYWTLSETTIEGDDAFMSLLTLGYDPQQEQFVGTWIDSNQPVLMAFEGQLDEAKKVLSYGGEGPSYVEPGKLTMFREQLELVAPDHKRTTSTMRGPDGEWITYMVVDAKRVE